MSRALLLFVLAVLMMSPARANPPLLADLSTYRIAIDAGFTGMRLFLFGTRSEIGDVVVVVRGPQHNYVVRQKSRVAGVWVNRDQMRLRSWPDYYAVASTRPLDELNAEALLTLLDAGTEALKPTNAEPEKLKFADAFMTHQQKQRLYPAAVPLVFMGDSLFKAIIPFPDTIAGGMYTAEIYLISDGVLIGMQTLPITVEKTGFDAAIYNLAHQHPAWYGLMAIAMAVGAGWLAGRIFSKR